MRDLMQTLLVDARTLTVRTEYVVVLVSLMVMLLLLYIALIMVGGRVGLGLALGVQASQS